MSEAGKQFAALANGAQLGIVIDGDAQPVVAIDSDLNVTAKRLGEIVPRLDLFELNGSQVFFNFKGEMKHMTARKFATWINNFVVMAAKFDRNSGDAVPGMLSPEAAGVVIDSENFQRGVRPLKGVNQVRCPVVRAGAKLELLPWGYDTETGIFTVPGGLEFDDDLDLAVAVARIRRVFEGFPFTDGRSLAVQVAGLLALFVRSLPGGSGLRPGFLWHANKPGTGKSVTAKACLYPVLGRAAAAKLKKDDNLDKEIEAFCRAGVSYIFLDNIRGGLNSTTIEQMLTSAESTGRAMGGHDVFTAKNTALLLATGNDLTLTEDAVRRFLIIDLFEVGNPQDRDIPDVLDDDKMATDWWRKEMLEALYALVRNWHEKGMPKGTRSLATYEGYAALLGGIVEAAGYDAPFQPFILPDSKTPGEQEFSELMALVLAEMEADVERDFSLLDLARLARVGTLFQREVGTADEGRRLTIKQDGLGAAERGLAEDKGYLTDSQNSMFSKRLKKEVGTNKKVGERVMEFGKRVQARKSTWTVTVLS